MGSLVKSHVCYDLYAFSVLKVKVLVGAFNQEKAIVGAFSFSVIVKVVEPMDRFTELNLNLWLGCK